MKSPMSRFSLLTLDFALSYTGSMNIVYNASAGTGKTYQVTSLYEKLVLEDGIDPRKILLMTFTENAAAELRMRVTHRLLKVRRTAETEGDGELAERAILAMSHLPSAPIGTIHSYCTRLLREHALEAGLSPGFSVLDEADRTELLNQICRDELLVRLASDPDFKVFCSGAQIIGSGSSFSTSITETVPKLIDEARSLGISLENAEAMLPDPLPTASVIDFENICQRIRALPRITPSVQTALDILQTALDESDDAETLVEKLNALGLKKFGRGEVNAISHDLWDLKESVEETVKYRERHPAAKAFARYAQAVAKQFQQRKHEMDSVDFDDQLHMAAELLKSGQAAPQFQYVLVDEVQDTSRIQYELIESLWKMVGTDRRAVRALQENGGLGEAALPHQTNLVICGDKKQSIYTWRGADPQVMPDLQKMILATGGTLENLQTSYRSKSPIIDVVNTLFASVYGEKEYTEGDHLKPNPDLATPGEKPGIEFLEADYEDDLSKQEMVSAEMGAVANRIQLLVKGSDEWKPAFRYSNGFLPTSESNGYRYSDILILLRRRSHQSELEKALRHAGIPYTLGGKGAGLFTRQETRDVSLFLNVITNPKDTYSLVGFLRSPWVGLTDETIAELAWSKDGFSVDNLLANYTRETDVVDRYRELLSSKLVSELVRMLIDETGYDALLAGLPRGTQRLANLRKVLDWLRETERGAQTIPASVARKLAEQIASPPQIPEAVLLDPARNAVTIMTVHGAKGLTKRVVVLPDTNAKQINETAFAKVFFDEQDAPTLGLRITAPDKSKTKSPGFQKAADRTKSIRDHEFKNLFYVAMTRARDLVIASATVGGTSAGWYKELEPLIGTDIPAIPYSALADAVEHARVETQKRPTADQLANALETLPPSPDKPTLQRISATRLAKELDEIDADRLYEPETFQSAENAAAMGSLAHAVLEQLALNAWEGSIANWIDILRNDFGISKQDALALEDRIEQTRKRMIELTAGMEDIRPEFPFVLHENHKLIDGTIDLLCRMNNEVSIFDYKFTEADDASVVEHYRGQMEVYRKAAERVFPDANNVAVQLIVVSSKKPRLVECR